MNVSGIIFKQPEFKKTYYLANTEKPIYFNLTDVTIKQMIKMKNDKGYMIIAKSSGCKDFFDAVDNASMKQLLGNNGKWFDNDLTEEDIRQMFSPSYCDQNNSVSIFLPSEVYTEITNIQDYLCHTAGKVLNFKIQHIGMYIYPNQTVNRWAVKTINMHNLEDVHLTESKEDIEAYWEDQVKKCDQALMSKIKYIHDTQDKLHKQYSSIVAEKFSNKDWECKIRDLQILIQNIIF